MKPGYKQTEVGVIPEEWEVKAMDSLTSLMTNGFVGTATSAYVNSDDGILYIQGYNVQEGGFNLHGIKRISKAFHARNQKSCLREGDLLTIQTGDIGVTTIVPKELVGANCHALVISRFIKQNSAPLFYCHYFNSERGRAKFKEIETGSTMKHLNVGDMKPLLIPSPPLPEQRAIAEVLSDMDALLAGLDKLIAKKREIKQAAMQQLLTGKTRLPGFGGEWELKHIESFAKVTTGSKNTQDRIADGLYPFFVRSQTVERINSYSCDGEAVLTAGDGVGTGKVFHYINGKFDIHQRVYRISDFAQEVNGYYFYLYFSTHFYNRIMQMTAKSSVDSVRRDMITRMPVPIPPTLPEQTAIAEVLSDMDAEISTLETRLEKTRALKQGMMQELLTGRIRLISREDAKPRSLEGKA